MRSTRFVATLLTLLSVAVAAQGPDSLPVISGLTIRNGDVELGEVGMPTPGFLVKAFFDPKIYASLPDRDLFPVTRAEGNSNRFIFVAGVAGLGEYTLFPLPFLLEEGGEVDISFRAKWTAGEDGIFHDGTRVALDFRCRNPDVEHGTVNERYPVLETKPFKPGAEWQAFSFRVSVKKGFRYLTWFRVRGARSSDALNGFCLDDLRMAPAGKTPSANGEIAISFTNRAAAFTGGEAAPFRAVALLPGTADHASIQIHIQGDWGNAVVRTATLELARDATFAQAAGRSRYTGTRILTGLPYGSFHTAAGWEGKPLPVTGGDFTVLHPLAPAPASLAMRLGSHVMVHQQNWASIGDNGAAAASPNGLGPTSLAKNLALAGIGHGMYAFDLKKVQPEPGRMDFARSDAEIGQLEKAGIEPVGCFGGWWIYTDRSKREDALVGYLPDWFYDDRYTRPSSGGNRSVARTLNEDVWRFHVESIVARYGGRIRRWMVLVEPQWVLSAEDYVKLQKIAYEIVKARDPKAFVIAGDATSDNGYNLTGWLEKLHGLGFEKYLDAASFNPYGSSLDYIGGERGRYSGLLGRIRNILAPGTALWEQELYFIANSKGPWRAAEQDVFSSGDAQRHYLLGLLNGLHGITAVDPGAHYKPMGDLGRPDSTVLGDVGAGLNALAHFLGNKTSVQALGFSNQLFRGGIFSGAGEGTSTAVVWVLQPKGMAIRIGEAPGVTIYDHYGNVLRPGPVLDLGLDPIYLMGDGAALKNILTRSPVITSDPVALYSRRFRERTCYGALNISGTKTVTVVEVDGVAPIRLPFLDGDALSYASDRGPSGNGFTIGLQGEASRQRGSVHPLPTNGGMILKGGENLDLSASPEAPLRIWVEGETLRIQARVQDKEVTPAPDGGVWNGDALEVFLDRTPFHRLDVDEFGGKAIPGLSVIQYIFAATPMAGGVSRSARDQATGKDIPGSRAEVKTLAVPGGWGLEVAIPLVEAGPVAGQQGIVGLNIEISRRDGAKSLPKFRLFGGDRDESWKKRAHYGLFQIPSPSPDLAANGDVENGMDLWSAIGKSTLSLTGDAWSGKQALRVSLQEEPAWGPTLVAGRFGLTTQPLAPGRYRVRLMARASTLNEFKVAIAGAKPKSYRGAAMPIAEAWTPYEAEFTVAETQTQGRVGFDFLTTRGVTDGWGMVDAVELERLPEEASK